MLVGISALDGGINFSDVGFTIVICVIYLLAMPVVLYFNAQKNYRTNKMIQGDMLYEFDPERIYVEGASYKGEFKLNALHKIKPTKNWLLLFHSKRTANFVNIRDCKQSDYEQITVMLQNSALPYKVNMYKSIQEKLKVDRCV
jgi:hypothetical protein